MATPRLHVHARRFPTPEAAQGALGTLAKDGQDHPVDSRRLTDHQRDTGQGRPTPTTPLQAIEWHIDAHVRPEDEVLRSQTPGKACVVLGTHICASQWSDPEVMAADKAHARVAGGFRCLHDPRLFVSSVGVQQPSRIQGRLLVMT